MVLHQIYKAHRLTVVKKSVVVSVEKDDGHIIVAAGGMQFKMVKWVGQHVTIYYLLQL